MLICWIFMYSNNISTASKISYVFWVNSQIYCDNFCTCIEGIQRHTWTRCLTTSVKPSIVLSSFVIDLSCLLITVSRRLPLRKYFDSFTVTVLSSKREQSCWIGLTISNNESQSMPPKNKPRVYENLFATIKAVIIQNILYKS